MPCAVPCDRIPCSVRCENILECSHRCPSVCGEICPGTKHCQKCATNDVLDRLTDLIMCTTYREADLDEDPVIFLSCGHFYTVSTLDGHMDLKSAYEIGDDGKILEPKNFSRTKMKACPECRAPLRNIHRYNRVVKGALLDEATKRFMAYAGTLQKELIDKVEENEQKLEDLANEFNMMTGLGDTANTAFFSKSARIEGYQKKANEACKQVSNFIRKVEKEEQPYGRVHSMVIDARRRRNAISKFELDNSVIQHGFKLRGEALLLRTMWAALWSFKSMSKSIPLEDFVKQWTDWVLPALAAAKGNCFGLLVDAEKTLFRIQEIEAMIYHAQFVALELNHAPERGTMPDAERAQILAVEINNLDHCSQLISGQPSASYLKDDVDKARRLLVGGTFYSFVSSDEKKAIYEAMSREFGGTGHWYYCEQGHPVCYAQYFT